MRKQGSTKKGMQILSLLLAATLFLGSQGFTVFAETISGNEGTEDLEQDIIVTEDEIINNNAGESEDFQPAAEEETSKVGDSGETDTEQAEGEDILEIEAVSDDSISINRTGVGEGTPANPVHHCTKKNDGTDKTDFTCIYFGSYPQSEVTDAATKQAIDSAISQGKGQTAGTAESREGIDVYVNGAKYRRISKEDTNDGGKKFTDIPASNGYRYFKWERIKWRVLQNDGKSLFVVADKAIDCKNYNDEKGIVTWENSTIRDWLNTNFYSTAFSSNEQSTIIEQPIANEDNPEYGTEGGNDTRDRIYLLSISEVTNEAYGFCNDYNTYSVSRRMEASDYANARGTWRESDAGYKGTCYWWLRSPGKVGSFFVDVIYAGGIHLFGKFAPLDVEGICPALHVSLSGGTWSIVESEINIQSLSVTAPSKKLAAGKKVKLTLDIIPQNATNKAVKWETSNKKYATVDANGKISLKKKGIGKNVTITAMAQDGSGKKASIKIKIMRHAVKSIKLTAPKKTLKAGKSMTIKAAVKTTGKNANKALKWKSSNKKYATVNKKGKVTAKKAGKGKTVTITATSTDGSNEKAKMKIKIK